MQLLRPFANSEFVQAACERFDRENEVVESALAELFDLFPLNNRASRVLLKATALNRLYSAGVLAVGKVADHIYQNRDQIDAALTGGSPSVVEKIARVTIKGKEYNFYSFATKYCNWHKPESYPIYDSLVEKYIHRLQKRDNFSSSFRRLDDLYSYEAFLRIMNEFRESYELSEFTFKQLDKFLWTAGGVASIEHSGKSLSEILGMVPNVSPDPGDELPEGWTPQ